MNCYFDVEIDMFWEDGNCVLVVEYYYNVYYGVMLGVVMEVFEFCGGI